MGMDMYADLEKQFGDEPCFCARGLAHEFGMGLGDLLKEKGCTLFDIVTCPDDIEYDESMYDSYEEYEAEGHLPTESIYLEVEKFEKEYEKALQIVKEADDSVFLYGKEGVLADLEELKEVIEFAKAKKTRIGLLIC